MKKRKKYLIITSIIAVLLVFGLYSQKDTKVSHLAMGSSLESSTGPFGGGLFGSSSSSSNQIHSEISFISTLSSIKNLEIDVSMFSNPLFSQLEDNSVKIEPVKAGRDNPFAPIGHKQGSGDSAQPRIITSSAVSVTDSSATLNGQINTSHSDLVSNIHFEYGPTENMGKTTPDVSQSLVGTFVANVSGLHPRVTYFFKACAKINRIDVCGDVVSFTTR